MRCSCRTRPQLSVCPALMPWNIFLRVSGAIRIIVFSCPLKKRMFRLDDKRLQNQKISSSLNFKGPHMLWCKNVANVLEAHLGKAQCPFCLHTHDSHPYILNYYCELPSNHRTCQRRLQDDITELPGGECNFITSQAGVLIAVKCYHLR